MKSFLRLMMLSVLACLFLCLATYAQTMPLELTVNAPTAGALPDKVSIGLTIKNTGNQSVSIERGINVEKFSDFKWSPATAIQAVASCEQFDDAGNWHGAIKIAAGETLTVVPFDNFGCGGQCVFNCLKTFRLGAGLYRFVIIGREGQRLPSPTFKLPDWH